MEFIERDFESNWKNARYMSAEKNDVIVIPWNRFHIVIILQVLLILKHYTWAGKYPLIIPV